MNHRTSVLAALIAAAGLLASALPAAAQATADPTDAVQQERAFARSLSRAFQAAAKSADPAVVHIKSLAERPVVQRDFFGRTYERTLKRSGLGSGVIVRDDGYILTNNHVIEDSTSLLVRLADGTEHAAEIVGTDELRDLAVLKIAASGLPAASFADSDAIEVGQWVIALGSPFGFERTVTAGIVSAKGRGLGIASDEFKDFEEFIQTDAAINPGNSGGPLIDLEGRVVGINTAIFSRGGGSVGLGFATPANLAQEVMTSLIERGTVDRGYLGVRMRELADQSGVEIAGIQDDTPAAGSGLREGDIVRQFNGRPVGTTDQLMRAIQFALPGSQADLLIDRSGAVRTVSVEVGDLTTARLAGLMEFNGTEIDQLGMIVADPAAVFTRGDELQGAVVMHVRTGGPAAEAGLQSNDLVESVDGEPISSTYDLARLMAGAEHGSATLVIRRPVQDRRGQFRMNRGTAVIRW